MAERLLDSDPLGKVVKAYLILVGMATRRQATPHGYMAEETEVAARAVGGLCLDPFMRYCQVKHFPNLTSIVTNKNTGDPETAMFLEKPYTVTERGSMNFRG